MAEKIGYQSGIKAAMNALRALDPDHKTAYDKLERTLTILANDHDAAVTPTPEPPPPPPPPDPPPLVAPLTYNAEGGSNARYCVAGLSRNEQGRYFDAYATYDDDGLQLGGRTETPVAGLKGSRSTDGKGPCESYEWGGRVFPPWPEESYQR